MQLRVIQCQYSPKLHRLKAVIKEKFFMVRVTQALQCPQLNCAPVRLLQCEEVGCLFLLPILLLKLTTTMHSGKKVLMQHVSCYVMFF